MVELGDFSFCNPDASQVKAVAVLRGSLAQLDRAADF